MHHRMSTSDGAMEDWKFLTPWRCPPENMQINTSIQHCFRWALVLGLSLAATACKIEHKSEAERRAKANPAGNFESKTFNPAAEVDAIWDSKVMPAISAMAMDYPALKKAMQTSMDKAGAQHGHREKGEGAPWNLATKVTGNIVETDTEVSAGTAGIDVNGDGKADVQIQIGPVLKGSTIRDILPFISFTAYTNQIEFAQLANAFNDRSYQSTFKSLDRTQLKGRKVELIGVFAAESAEDLPLLTVVAFKVLNP